jgi:hypothetical protein
VSTGVRHALATFILGALIGHFFGLPAAALVIAVTSVLTLLDARRDRRR